jgi:hypothetical protein
LLHLYIQSILEPDKKHVIEARREDRRQQDERGDEPGAGDPE